MRGSIKWQVKQLERVIFQEKVSKVARTDPASEHYGKIASYGTMKTYREVWRDFARWLREQEDGTKDLERVTGEHVARYMEDKLLAGVSQQHLQKICSALGALERALERYAETKWGEARDYDFSRRFQVLQMARDYALVYDGYHNRAYTRPQAIIARLTRPAHRLAAQIQLEGGARLKGVGLIRQEQLRGIHTDKYTGKPVGVITTKEKGGKVGDVTMTPATYAAVERYIKTHGELRVNRFAYLRELREAAAAVGEPAEGSHGLRWNFAQERMHELQDHGYTYEQALQIVSWEMKHERASITEHYLGR